MNKANNPTTQGESDHWRVVDRIERQNACAGNEFLEGHIRGRLELVNGYAIEVGLTAEPGADYRPQLSLSVDDDCGRCVGEAYAFNLTADDLAALGVFFTEVAARARTALPAMVEVMRREEAASAAAIGKYDTYDAETRGGVLV